MILIQTLVLAFHRLQRFTVDRIAMNLRIFPTSRGDADHHPRSSCRTLTVSSLNARSIKNKSAMFDDYLYDYKADLFAITETWLSVNDSAVCREITPSGFKLFHSP